MKFKKNKNIIILLLFFATLSIFIFSRVSGLLMKEDVVVKSDNITNFSRLYFNKGDSFQFKKILLFIDFDDFNCPPCEEGVNIFCQVLKKVTKGNDEKNVIILIRKRKGSKIFYSNLISNWRKENDIELPFLLDEEFFFEKSNISKTSVALLNEEHKIIVYKEFPMNKKEMNKILDLFKN